ncbi:MAG: diphosphomevalonate decarboxylase [bacterium]
MTDPGRSPRLHRHRRRQLRPGQVLGQARRRPEPAGGGQHLDDARRPGHHHHRRLRSALATDAFTLGGRALAGRRLRGPGCGAGRGGHRPAGPGRQRNTVATAAGLASSASGMAALGLAAWGAAGLAVDQPAAQPALVEIVRRGSGSAPRSLLGGLVELRVDDASVHPLASPDAWPLAIVVARVGHGEKKVKSRPGMTHTAETSPYYAPWIAAHPADLAAARAAIAARDLPALGAVMERSTLRMHACMWAADPPLRYLRGRTLDLMDAVEALRDAGVGAWYTMDAGPHVKVLCAAADASGVAAALATVPGLASVEICQPGPGATAEVLP